MLLCQPPVHLKQEVPSVQELKRKERASEKYLMFTDMSLATMWKLQIMYREGGGEASEAQPNCAKTTGTKFKVSGKT